jgi:hypothetical protein
MPGNDCLRFDDQKGRSPAAPKSREPDPKQPICDRQSEPAISVGSPKDYELMAKSENLGLERSSTPKALPNRSKKRENDREPVVGKL